MSKHRDKLEKVWQLSGDMYKKYTKKRNRLKNEDSYQMGFTDGVLFAAGEIGCSIDMAGFLRGKQLDLNEADE